MGSRSDWETMQHAAQRLEALGVAHEVRVVSAHRTPDLLFDYAAQAGARGLRAIIAGAGGAAHLPGMLAAKTAVPVLGVPVQSKALNGLDSLLSIVQMPAGIPVATFAIGAPAPRMRRCSPLRCSPPKTRASARARPRSAASRPTTCWP
jgi:5-(carboxyamino)imidazole ribonucleotide mutase